jgi:hypothetical protein
MRYLNRSTFPRSRIGLLMCTLKLFAEHFVGSLVSVLWASSLHSCSDRSPFSAVSVFDTVGLFTEEQRSTRLSQGR